MFKVQSARKGRLGAYIIVVVEKELSKLPEFYITKKCHMLPLVYIEGESYISFATCYLLTTLLHFICLLLIPLENHVIQSIEWMTSEGLEQHNNNRTTYRLSFEATLEAIPGRYIHKRRWMMMGWDRGRIFQQKVHREGWCRASASNSHVIGCSHRGITVEL